MPYTKIYIHTVWATKNREPLLDKSIRQKVFKHIQENAKTKGICIDSINGFTDHVHCLIQLNSEQNIATVMNLIKGESSYWINKNKMTQTKFGWQDEYFAVSVGQSQIVQVLNYIRNQEVHHGKKSFKDEYDEFIKNYEFEEC